MLWLTSLLFLSIAKTAIRKKHPFGNLIGTLGISSVLHHTRAIAENAVRIIDTALAHVTGFSLICNGIEKKAWHLIPHAVWIITAFYYIEPRAKPEHVNWVHASIHVVSAHAMHDLIDM